MRGEDVVRMAAEVMAVACAHLCEQMAVGVIACDRRLSVLAMSPRARVLLAHFEGDQPFGDRLPRAVAAAVRAYLRRAEGAPGCAWVVPVRVEMPDGLLAIHVAGTRIDAPPPSAGPLAVVVRVREDGFADEDLFHALRGDFHLSPRDRRLIVLLRQGGTNAEMACTLGLTTGTLKVYLHELYEKFDVHSRWQLLALFERIRAAR